MFATAVRWQAAAMLLRHRRLSNQSPKARLQQGGRSSLATADCSSYDGSYEFDCGYEHSNSRHAHVMAVLSLNYDDGYLALCASFL